MWPAQPETAVVIVWHSLGAGTAAGVAAFDGAVGGRAPSAWGV